MPDLLALEANNRIVIRYSIPRRACSHFYPIRLFFLNFLVLCHTQKISRLRNQVIGTFFGNTENPLIILL